MCFKTIFFKAIVFVVALQILNLSIYAQDYNPIKSSNVLYETNEINSIMEYVGEIVLKHQNQFPEYPNDGQKNLQLKHTALTTFSFQYLKVQSCTNKAVINYIVPVTEDYYFLFLKEINPPPPKA